MLLVGLLLVGGGLGPPLLGLILGVAALGMNSVSRRPRRRSLLPLAQAWPWILVVGVVGYLALFPGSVLLYLLRWSRQRNPGVRPHVHLVRRVDLVPGRCPSRRSKDGARPASRRRSRRCRVRTHVTIAATGSSAIADLSASRLLAKWSAWETVSWHCLLGRSGYRGRRPARSSRTPIGVSLRSWFCSARRSWSG